MLILAHYPNAVLQYVVLIIPSRTIMPLYGLKAPSRHILSQKNQENETFGLLTEQLIRYELESEGNWSNPKPKPKHNQLYIVYIVYALYTLYPLCIPCVSRSATSILHYPFMLHHLQQPP